MLTSVADIRALSAERVAQGRPVELHAVLTYYEPREGQVFAQDATGGIYVQPPKDLSGLSAGDSVVIRGILVPSYAANVQASEIQSLGPARFPIPVSVGWREIVQRENDCRYVTVQGTVRSATPQQPVGRAPAWRQVAGQANTAASQPYLLLNVQIDGGLLRVHMENPGNIDPLSLLDSRVRIEGVAGGVFDGKLQQVGAELWVSGADHMQILEHAPASIAALPLTPIPRIMNQTWIRDESRRVHIRGSVTFYQPGLQLVVETPRHESVLVNTFEQSPLQIGQVIDVVGFPFPQQYSEVITQANILSRGALQPIAPAPISWNDALAGRYAWNLVSMEGRLAAEVHELHQDTLVIQSGPHVFSAILPRPVWNQEFDRLTLPPYRIGSRVRVTGVCFVHAGGPWSTERWFELQMRSADDVAVLRRASWWTAGRLLRLGAALMVLMVGALLWAALLQRKVRRQTAQIRRTAEAEAARERATAQLETERSHVLEAINSTRDLDEVLAMILTLIGSQLPNKGCWFDLVGGRRVGIAAPADSTARILEREILSGAGEKLGRLAVRGADTSHTFGGEILEMGASLAGLAIDNRRLYETLVHRSQYDQLTNAANRFLLESRLDEALTASARTRSRCALIYVDLDDFKLVNDRYGHRAGDLYLQQVTQRFSEKLRSMDTLARVGGDEFIALIPTVRGRTEAEEIAQRLTRCFDTPFPIEECSIRGSASIGIAVYPEDGTTRDELKRVADNAMYESKTSTAR